MNLSIIEEAVLYSALKAYIPYCEECLANPANANQQTFIKADISIARDLLRKIKDDYTLQGGDPSQL